MPFSALPTRLRTLLLAAALAVVPVAAVQAQSTPAPQMHLPRAQVRIGSQTAQVQIATTPLQHEIGLMHRASMPANEGMLFVFDGDYMQCFWMKNTLLPLTAAFVARDGTIVNLADMAPQTEQSHCSAQPVRYVLEMHQGWFKMHHIRPGARLQDKAGRFFR